jgi:itaconate CoA-transferase
VDNVFSRLDSREVIARLESADIANARLNDMSQFWRHPQLDARSRWARVGIPGGQIDMLKPPINLSGFEPRMDAIPALGEHSRAILSELGYAERELEALAASGAIR